MRNLLNRVMMATLLLGLVGLPGCATSLKQAARFPDFITPNADYYVTRIGEVPEIDEATYRLKIFGQVKQPKSFTLDELNQLEMVELPLTVECIGNKVDGTLISTAIWKGFYLYDLLITLGLDETATGVRYKAADGYYASHTLEQLKTNKIVGALYMNDQVIPPKHGFPLRFLNPGFHGVKQPAWVTEVEVIDQPVKDYWEDRGWDCSPPMAIDTTIFFPDDNARIKAGETLMVGGAAFGGERVARVDVTADDGKTWQQAEIVQQVDQDHVWVFWEAALVFPTKGRFTIQVKAEDIHGNVQSANDADKYNGLSSWAKVAVKVVR